MILARALANLDILVVRRGFLFVCMYPLNYWGQIRNIQMRCGGVLMSIPPLKHTPSPITFFFLSFLPSFRSIHLTCNKQEEEQLDTILITVTSSERLHVEFATTFLLRRNPPTISTWTRVLWSYDFPEPLLPVTRRRRPARREAVGSDFLNT